MKTILSIIFCSNFFYFTTIKNDTETKINILKAIFSKTELVDIKGEQVMHTKARGKFASIPLNESTCRLLRFENNIVALVFNIYLSENRLHYSQMQNAALYNFMDLEKGSELEVLTKNERLIQLVFYDLKKKKFLAKADGFPIEGLPWLPTGMGDVTQIISISDFKIISKSKHSCYLSLTECPDCNNSVYCFKYFQGKVLASNKYNKCFESIIETGKKIMVKEITNCYEFNYENEAPKYEVINLLKW